VTVFGSARPLPAGARPIRRAQGAARGATASRSAALPRAAPLPGVVALPRVGARPVAITPRRRLSRASRISTRSHPARPLIGAVLIAFLIGLIYLAQTVHLAATNYEIGQLQAQRDDLYRQVQTAETSVLAWGTEPTALQHAQQLGLDQLASRVRLSAR
jgi:hypothetical protein